MRSIFRLLARRHTTAVAYVALIAALGGSAYAAVSVSGKNIKDGTVTGRDVKDRSLALSEAGQPGDELPASASQDFFTQPRRRHAPPSRPRRPSLGLRSPTHHSASR